MHSDQVADLRGVHILANFRDSAHDFVTGNEWRVLPGLDLIEEVEVRSADAGSEDLHPDVLGAWLRVRKLDEFDRASRFEPNGTHGEPPSSVPHKTVCPVARVFVRIRPGTAWGDRNREVPEIRAGPGEGISLAGTESMWARMRGTPFSLWVIAGALTYSALALVVLALPVVLAGGITAGGGLLLFLFLFVALFLIAAAFTLRQKRLAYVLGAAVAIVLVILFSSFILTSLSNPADSGFWLAVSVLPLLLLAVVFSVLSFINTKAGLNQKRYLATPMSSGGLLAVAVIGFVVGGLVVGAIGGAVIRGGLEAGSAGVAVVSGSATGGAEPPTTLTLPPSARGEGTLVHKNSTGHNGTEKAGLFDSGTFTTLRTWSYTFTQAGSYQYYCTIHPNMVGTIVVAQ